MGYRPYSPPSPLLIGYDPERDLPHDHLVRLVDQVVEESVKRTNKRGRGQPAFDPRLCIKVLVYGYATGVRSSRQLERLCGESLPYLYLTRGDTPSYRTLCRVRQEQPELVEAVWVGLFAVGAEVGMKRMGRIVVDSTKLRANASTDSILGRDEFVAVKQELGRILQEAESVDAQEQSEGYAGETRLSQRVEREQMREILRRVRKQSAEAKRKGASCVAEAKGAPPPSPAPKPRVSRKMCARLQAGMKAITAAEAEGTAHVCLTDPDARMMLGGVEKTVHECHSFEVAVDNGLLVAGGSTQQGPDNDRLEPLVQEAKRHEPEGVKAVDGDSGYYSGDAVARLLEAGIDLCIPSSFTACDLHRGEPVGSRQQRNRGSVPFTYDPHADVYHCPQGNELRPTHQRQHCGQRVTVYRARASCEGCPQAQDCLTQKHAKRRTLKVSRYQDRLLVDQQRFSDPAHRERYRQRGPAVETVFGFLRGTLGYLRWLLRGAQGIAREATLFKLAYQIRKVHTTWALAK